MKLSLALAAILFALTSVAAEAPSCRMSHEHAPASPGVISLPQSDASGLNCHESAGVGTTGKNGGCDIAASCALLCCVVPPPGPDSALPQHSLSILFRATILPLTGVIRRPEAPPPRVPIL